MIREDKELAIMLIIAAIVVAFFYIKMALIHHDVMKARSRQMIKDVKRLHKLRESRSKC